MRTNMPYGVNDLDIITRLYRKQNKIEKSYRVTYQSKDGKKDFIGAADKSEVDEKVKELKDHDHKILDVNIIKERVYIKNPQEAPQDVKLERGKRGGLYYEGDITTTQNIESEKPVERIIQDAMQSIPKSLILKLNVVMQAFMEGKTSKNMNIDKLGNYTPKRTEIHKKIMNEFIGKNSQSQQKIAILMGGPTASGKSSLLRNKNVDFNQFVNINNDDIKSRLPGYTGINAELYHDEARDIVNSLLTIALNDNRNIIIDGTMRNLNYEILKIKMLKERGYKIKVISLMCDLKTTIVRSLRRFIEEKRFVPIDYIAKTTDSINKVQREYQKYADEYELYDSNTLPPRRLI